MEFIRIFDNEKEADDLIGKFIGKDGNIDYKKMTTEYDWDEVFGIIRQYVVSY